MIVVGTAEHGRKRRRHLKVANGFEYYKSEWLETDQSPQRSPTAFLVEQPPNSVLNTHFHVQNEFQVVVDGFGMFGRHPVRAIGVHYAGAYTGYGPIAAGPQGLKYFTIRSVFEQGAFFVPEAREQLLSGPKLQRYGAPVDPSDAARLRSLQEIECADLFDPVDGVLAQLLRLPPKRRFEPVHQGPSDGKILMVVAGSADASGTRLGPWEMVYVSPEERDVAFAATEEGAEVLVMQIPPRAEAYRG